MKLRHKLLSLAAIGLIAVSLLALTNGFFTSPISARSPATPTKSSARLPSPPQKTATPAVRQVATVPQEYGAGLYRIQFAEYQTTSLTQQFPSIQQWTETGYTEDGEIPPDYPATTNVADMRILAKNLRLAAIYSPYPRWCDRGGYCPLELSYLNGSQWKGVISEVVSPDQYLLVEDNSISLILCRPGRHGYEQFRLADGRLERPITVSDGEYFTLVGAFANPALAPCK